MSKTINISGQDPIFRSSHRKMNNYLNTYLWNLSVNLFFKFNFYMFHLEPTPFSLNKNNKFIGK